MRKNKVLEQLEKVDEEEWLVILSKAKEHIKIKTRGRTSYGAYSEENLGMSAIDYYVGETLKKLFEGTRDWKFETRSLVAEFIRIIDSIITEEVRKINIRKDGSTKIISVDPEVFVDETEIKTENIEEVYSSQIDAILEVISEDKELEEIFLLIHDGNNYEQISKKMDIPKLKIYRAIEKIKRKVKATIK